MCLCMRMVVLYTAHRAIMSRAHILSYQRISMQYHHRRKDFIVEQKIVFKVFPQQNYCFDCMLSTPIYWFTSKSITFFFTSKTMQLSVILVPLQRQAPIVCRFERQCFTKNTSLITHTDQKWGQMGMLYVLYSIQLSVIVLHSV